ncbi:MAG: alpha/beta hydrolase domain-containing protein [Aliidongia sp.]
MLPTYAVRVDSDGNEYIGVRSVLLQAPLATYTGWNIYAAGIYKGQQCALSGSSFPFEETKAERIAARDPRPSLEERYGSHQGYVCVVTRAANEAVGQRFLLSTAATTLIAEAQAGNVLTDITPTAEDQKVAGRPLLVPWRLALRRPMARPPLQIRPLPPPRAERRHDARRSPRRSASAWPMRSRRAISSPERNSTNRRSRGRFGASRTPVREALRELASAGLVNIQPRRGVRVATLTADHLGDLFELMAETEAMCARLATYRMTPQERFALQYAAPCRARRRPHGRCERL